MQRWLPPCLESRRSLCNGMRDTSFIGWTSKRLFDTILHSSVISMLMRQGVDMKVTYAIAREITHTYQHVKMFGLAADMPTRMFRGIKQGSPLSGILFVATVGEKLQELQVKWQGEGMGIWIDTLHLSHLLFADDLVLIAPSGYHIKKCLPIWRGFWLRLGCISMQKSCLTFMGRTRQRWRLQSKGL